MATIPAKTETKLVVTRATIEWDEAGAPIILSYEAHTVDATGAVVRTTDGFVGQADISPGMKGTLAAIGRLVEVRLAAWADL